MNRFDRRQRRRLIAFAYAQRIPYEAICDRFICSDTTLYRACREFRVKTGAKRRESPVWKTVDWTRPPKQIAADLGVPLDTVYTTRRRWRMKGRLKR